MRKGVKYLFFTLFPRDKDVLKEIYLGSHNTVGGKRKKPKTKNQKPKTKKTRKSRRKRR